MTIVYDFLATSHRLRAGPNAKTKDDRTDKLIYKLFRIKVGATFKCFKYIFMKSENITLRQSFISTTFEYTLNVQFSQKRKSLQTNMFFSNIKSISDTTISHVI